MSLHLSLKQASPEERLQLLMKTGMSRQSAEDYLSNWERTLPEITKRKLEGKFTESQAFKDIQERVKQRFGR